MNSLRSIADILRRDGKRSFQLAYVKTFSKPFAQNPNFICIGAPKAATTWLHNRLNMHPEVFLPKDKELHFFDEPYQSKSSVKTKGSVFFGKHKKYDLLNESHWKWYRLQFEKGAGKIKGDITPTYARISSERISKIYSNLPNIKIIYIVRNPIERAWSGASYFLHRWYGKNMQNIGDKGQLLEWVMNEERLDHGLYMEKIMRWGSVYPKKQIKYIFYDDICVEPDEVLNSICEYINADASLLGDKKEHGKKVNTAYPKHKMPDFIHQALLEYYENEIDALAEYFNRDLSEWKKLE